MAYRILDSETVQEAVQRIALEQIGKALDEIADEDRHEAVHQVRKRGKKIRALVRLVRPEFERYADENARFRDAARRLSDLRDATAFVETVDRLTEISDELNRAPLADLRRSLFERRVRLVEQQDLTQRLGEFAETLEQARHEVGRWGLSADGFDAVAGGLKKTYGRARDAMEAAWSEPSDVRFHELRKRAKYHRYHLRLLERAWPPVLETLEAQSHDFTDLLGEHHDLAELCAVMRAEGEALLPERQRQTVLGVARERQVELAARARPLARRLFAEEPRRCVDRYARWWDAGAAR